MLNTVWPRVLNPFLWITQNFSVLMVSADRLPEFVNKFCLKGNIDARVWACDTYRTHRHTPQSSIISYHTVPESWIPLFAFLSLLWIRKWKSKRHISLSEKHSFYCHHRLTRIEWLTSMALGLSRLSLFFTVWHIFSYEFFSLASLILIEREKTVFSFLFSGRRCLCGTRYCVVADHNKNIQIICDPYFCTPCTIRFSKTKKPTKRYTTN